MQNIRNREKAKKKSSSKVPEGKTGDWQSSGERQNLDREEDEQNIKWKVVGMGGNPV